ncbi:membrane protein [soil metagenome]
MSLHPVPVPTREEVIRAYTKPTPKALTLTLLVLAAIGTLAFIVGLMADPDRAWRAYHVSWLFFTSLSSAGVLFVAVQRITTARWSRAIIRFEEGFVAFLPVAFVLLLLTMFVGKNHIFPWTHEVPPVPEKVTYYNPTFLTLRVLVSYAIITVLSVWFVYTSVRLDVGLVPEAGSKWAAGLRARMRNGFRDERRELHSTHSIQGKLAVFLALAFGYGWSILAFDLSMGLSLHFQSTLYGWWFFMGAWLCGLTLFTLLVMAWRRFLGVEAIIGENIFHDLGKLCFAFTAFWGYLTFSQFLIIWYANLGEETHWPRLRLISPWVHFSEAAVLMVFFAPFFGLLSRAAKVFRPTLTLFTLISLVGMFLVRYLEVYPSLYGETMANPFGIWEVAIMLGYAGIWGTCYLAFMNAFPRMRVAMMTSPYRDEVQVPVDAGTMEPLPAHE